MRKERFIYPATLLCDFYKVSHRVQYPEGTEKIFSTWTPRKSRINGIDEVIAFGFQAFIKEYLIDYFNDNFFNRDVEDVIVEYERVIKFTLGVDNPDSSHIKALHELGYMPVKICAVEEGTLVPMRVPMLTIENTIPEFFWITNYLETLMSTELWMPATSATIAYQYKKILDKYAKETGNVDFVPFQGHDFSMRGMSTLNASKSSGAGHLLSFVGTDTIPAILYHEQYYNANIEKELIGTSIPATEHSVMCSYGEGCEFDTYKRLINEVYPNGFVSIVSDTWDLWKVLDEVIKPLKEDILNRDGKVVIRPDSGDPVDIICGKELKNPTPDKPISYSDAIECGWDIDYSEAVHKGVIEILWDIFGGTVNDKGYKELNPHIGAIYGDAITIERATQISERLKVKGFASTNIVYGIGSFTYQYNTRDTFGFALKSTYVKVNGEERQIFKDPITDDGTKKSAKGLVAVYRDSDGNIQLRNGLIELNKKEIGRIDMLKPIFEDGKILKEISLREIRDRLK